MNCIYNVHANVGWTIWLTLYKCEHPRITVVVLFTVVSIKVMVMHDPMQCVTRIKMPLVYYLRGSQISI
jgi:hypothetical protein